jgi:hypothetical protein
MRKTNFPKGWDQARVSKLLSSYESQTEDEAVAEDEAALEHRETTMTVPHELVPQIRELIAKHRQ